jgi:hypothetical protein
MVPNTVPVTKSRRMRQVGHMACMREKKKAYRVLERKKEGKRQF